MHRLLLLTTVLMGSVLGQAQTALQLSGDVVGTHDPSIIKAGGTFYAFATGKAPDGGQFAVRCSLDAHTWKLCGHVLDKIPAWIQERSPGTKELWAPDIAYDQGEFRLYYAYSLFGKNTSGIGLLTNKTLDPKGSLFRWVDKGLVLESKSTDDYNAIDANYVLDQHGNAWLLFGSFWDGIKLVRLDRASGMRSAADRTVYPIARRTGSRSLRTSTDTAHEQKTGAPDAVATNGKVELPPDAEAIEAPFIVRHGGYFYLFTSWDLCCRGNRSTYRTMVGRSRSVTGPYLDMTGAALAKGGGSPFLTANSHWFGPGGASFLMDTRVDGKPMDLAIFHAYDAQTGKPSMQISTIAWSADGWPSVAMEP